MFKIKKNNFSKYDKHLTIKLLVCLVYLIVITMLTVGSYKLYKNKKSILPWSKAAKETDYSYIKVSKMSEKFAYYSDTNKELHFVIEKEATGEWHTYIIMIKDTDYNKYKSIIDYSYERTTAIPKAIKVYGYPTLIDDNLKTLAINNIKNFVPAENEVEITSSNFTTYLTNCYLDTTIKRKDSFDIILCLSLFMLAVMIIMLFTTIFTKIPKVADTTNGGK